MGLETGTTGHSRGYLPTISSRTLTKLDAAQPTDKKGEHPSESEVTLHDRKTYAGASAG